MREILFAFPIIGILWIMGCEETPTAPEVSPSVTYAAIENGAKLRLTWTAVSDADGYNIYIDGVKDTSITAISYDVSGPAKKIEVCAYTDSEEGPKWELSLTPVVTTLTVYGRSDTSPDHPSGFGFTSDGTAVTYALSDSTNWPKIDFFIEDVGIPIALWSPHHMNYNTEENASVESPTITEFDSLNSAAAPGSYSTQTSLSTGGLYSIWIDPNASGWDATNDHFGKLKVSDISGTKVDIRVAYQKITGIRWVVTD